MGTPLRVLIVEDSEEDTLLVVRHLKRGGYDPVYERVESAESMKKVLSTQTWDLILADYSMPHFSGLEALRLLKESGLNIPFIIVSGSIGEDTAVAAMKAGANDYLMKNNLNRLIPAIEQELREAETRRKLRESEKALRESQEKCRQLVESATEIIYTIDEKGNFTYGNPAGLKVTGYSLQELRELNYADLVLPEHRERVMEIYINQFRQRIPTTHIEFPFLSKTGKIIWFSQNSSLVIEDGKVVGFHIIARDITERKQAEEALKASEERFRLAAESSTDLIYEWDIKERVDWFGKIDELLGYAPSEFPRTFEAWANSVHPDDRDRVKAAVKNHLEKNEPYDIEYRIRKKDGTYNYWWARGTAVRDEKGNPCRWVGAVTDITERKRAGETLRKSEERFRELYDNAPVGYFECDAQGRIASVNRTELEMLGYTAEEMIGHPLWEFLVGEETVRQQILGKLAGTIPPARGLERTYKRKDGTILPVLVEDRLHRDGNGKITGLRSTIQDITERKRAEEEKAALQEQLRQSQKIEAIGRLAGGIAHDFNNLLTVIKGYSQLSLVETKDGSPLKENLEEIKKAAERAADLTRQLLAFSRRQILEMKVLDLNSLLMDLDKMLRRVIGEDIELMTIPAEDLGRVRTDPGWIEQVIMNLAVNARDAMINGGRLTIETADVELDEAYARRHIAVKPGRYVMLSVSDTGVGMTPELRQQVFEPFFTTKEKGKGTGLGLSTVYGIVKQSGGNIWIYSEPGKGTTFKIYLPMVDEPLEELKERVETKELPHGEETILVVEDNEEVRKLAMRILQRQGYEVLEAPEGMEAFLLCEEHEGSIHLLVTDVVMPKMSGRELAERIASIRPEIKVLYMSGYTDNAIVHHGILSEGINYIQKPFTVESLIRKVREVLDQSSK